MTLIKLASGGHAIVDDEDVERVSKHRWHLTGGYCATVMKTDGKWKRMLMHHFIIGKPPRRMVTDHANGNKLDNRRSNLRFATHSQNAHNTYRHKSNTSGFKGVWWSSDAKCWMANINVRGIGIHLGKFNTAYEAHLAYRTKAKELLGEFANDGFGPIA